MPSTRLNRAMALAALASTSALTVAQAAIYTGSWDPAFGQPFPDLGWRGQATYFIPDACLGLSGAISSSNTCNGGTEGSFRVLSARVEFYSLSASTPSAPAPTLETLNYGSNSLQISSVTVTNHTLTGVITGYSPVALARQPIAGGGNYLFALRFDGPNAILAWTQELDTGKPIYHVSPLPAPAVLFTLTPVPEPGTLATLATGLGGIALAWQRRRRR